MALVFDWCDVSFVSPVDAVGKISDVAWGQVGLAFRSVGGHDVSVHDGPEFEDGLDK